MRLRNPGPKTKHFEIVKMKVKPPCLKITILELQNAAQEPRSQSKTFEKQWLKMLLRNPVPK